MEDREIIQLFHARSEEAIRGLNDKYGPACQRLALNVLRDPLDAEECVNDAYMAVWKAVPPAAPSPLFAYLCRIVRNLSIECYRKKHAAKRDDSLTASWNELEDCLPSAHRVEDQVDARELTRLLDRFLEELPRQDRLIFMRRYWFLDSCRQISCLCGMSEKNVSVRLTRLRKKLRTYLLENEVYL